MPATPSERVLGYACFGATPMTEATFDLYWLVVARGARGRGIGGALFAAVEDELKQRGGAHRPRRDVEPRGAGRRARASTRRPASGWRARSPTSTAQGDDLLVFAKVL